MRRLNLADLSSRVDEASSYSNFGYITRVVGLIIEAQGPEVSIGELCLIKHQQKTMRAEVVGFDNNKVLLMPIGDMEGITPGARVVATGERMTVKVGEELLGHILDGLGRPVGKELVPMPGLEEMPLKAEPPDPLTRERITQPLALGIRSIDG